MRVRKLLRTDDVQVFSGNGKAFLLLGEDCRQFVDCNFSMEPLHHKNTGVDYFVTEEIAVCCGSGVTRKSTVQALRVLIRKIEEGECDPCS
jgi:hypothetical protein